MIPLFKVFVDKDVHKEIKKTLDTGFIGQGKKVEEFESKLKDYFGVDFVSTVNAATSGEHLALHMMKKPIMESFDVCAQREIWPGMEDGDEVLTTPLTCTATNWPILGSLINQLNKLFSQLRLPLLDVLHLNNCVNKRSSVN